MIHLLQSADVDRRLAWPIGRAERLARRGRLPHVRLPDGSIRFRWREIARMIEYVGTTTAEDRQEVGDGRSTAS